MKHKHIIAFIIFCVLFVSILVTLGSNKCDKSLKSLQGGQFKLGTVDFPASTHSCGAEQHFLQGLRYLHNFMYPLALREFTISKKMDPSFALSYWGIAMSYFNPLWSYIDKAKGQQILYELEDVKNPEMTDLEKGLIQAINLIYQSGNQLENEKKYLNAMKKLYERYSDNPDITSFYALSLLGYAGDAPFEKDSLNHLQTAQKVLEPFLKTHPEHPGIVHYYVHATDITNAKIAKQGLKTTKNIYEFMADSSHVVHMPAHLYTVLGRWEEAAKANQLSIAASNRICRYLENQDIRFDSPLTFCVTKPRKKMTWPAKNWYACDAENLYHSTEWLQYEYLQMGKYQQAFELVNDMDKVVKIEELPMYYFWLYRTEARQTLDTQNWKPVKSLPKEITKNNADAYWASYSESGRLLADGLSAIHNHQLKYLPLIKNRFETILDILAKNPEGVFRNACLVSLNELRAAEEAYVNHNTDKSIYYLEEALKIQNEIQATQQSFLLPYVPAEEVYAEILMENPTIPNLHKAIALFKTELNYHSNRLQALLGLARAEAKLNNKKNALYWYHRILDQLKDADESKILKEAKNYVASNET